MDRRSFLRGAVFAASTPVVINEARQFSLDEFMSRASDTEKLHYHMAAAADAMNAIRPENAHIAKFDHAAGMAIVMPI